MLAQLIVEAYRRYRYMLFLGGHNGFLSATVPRFFPLAFINHRFQFTNHYPEVSATQVRCALSFFASNRTTCHRPGTSNYPSLSCEGVFCPPGWGWVPQHHCCSPQVFWAWQAQRACSPGLQAHNSMQAAGVMRAGELRVCT